MDALGLYNLGFVDERDEYNVSFQDTRIIVCSWANTCLDYLFMINEIKGPQSNLNHAYK